MESILDEFVAAVTKDNPCCTRKTDKHKLSEADLEKYVEEHVYEAKFQFNATTGKKEMTLQIPKKEICVHPDSCPRGNTTDTFVSIGIE